MNPIRPSFYHIQPEIALSLNRGMGVVALESAVVTHGLPHPVNLELAKDLERIVTENGATPATIALMNGKIMVGLSDEELRILAASNDSLKVNNLMMGIGLSRKVLGGTTVSATLIAAHTVGIQVFATGGIGGVHRGYPMDVSADLQELSRQPLIVVCAGAKAILDLPATLEVLETRGVPVLGYGTEEFPAFYSRESGLMVHARVETPEEVVEIAKLHWKTGNRSAVLVCNPLPADQSLEAQYVERIVEKALELAAKKRIKGSELTPFLLSETSKITEGKTTQANLALLRNNARLAALIATGLEKPKSIHF